MSELETAPGTQRETLTSLCGGPDSSGSNPSPRPGRIAGILQRAKGAAFTVVVLWICGVPCNCLFDAPALGYTDPALRTLNAIIFFIVLWGPQVLFNAGYCAKTGATIGMGIAGLTFSADPPGPIGAFQCFRRSLMGVVCVPLLPLSLAIMLTDRHSRSLPDIICRTTVRVLRRDTARDPAKKSSGDRSSNDLPCCENCGYSLKGLVSSRCPECGQPFARVGTSGRAGRE